MNIGISSINGAFSVATLNCRGNQGKPCHSSVGYGQVVSTQFEAGGMIPISGSSPLYMEINHVHKWEGNWSFYIILPDFTQSSSPKYQNYWEQPWTLRFQSGGTTDFKGLGLRGISSFISSTAETSTCWSQTHWRRSCQWTTQVVRPIQARPLIRTLFSAPLTVLSQLSSTGPQRHSTRHTTASWTIERSERSEGKLEFIKQK